MKRKTTTLLLGLTISAMFLTGCGKKNEATEAVAESERTQAEGIGETETEETGEDAGKEVSETEEAKDSEAGDSEENGGAAGDGGTDDSGAKDSQTEEASAEEAGEDTTASAETVGILLPCMEADEDWIREKEALTAGISEKGYDGRFYYADEDADTQVSQILELAASEEPPEALIICPVDIYALTDALEAADDAGIALISYDRLIMDSGTLNYYVTFDTRKMGNEIANSIVKKLDLENVRKNNESRTIEFLMGSPDDNQALFLAGGVLEVLQEYFDDGTLVCRSQKTSFDDTAVMDADTEVASERFAEILSEFYAEEGTPDVICTADDSFALAVSEQLEEAGILPGTEEWPLITGVGATADGVKSVAEGKLGFTMFSDREELADACAALVTTYLGGDDPEVTNYEQYDNGVKIIGTVTCEAELIDGDNYRLLIDNGFYEESEIIPEVTPTPEPTATPTPEPTATPTPTAAAVPDN